MEVRFCDLPKIEGPAGRFMLRQMLAVAELEAGLISERTKKALAAAKARGVRLGGDRGSLQAANHKGREISREIRIRKAGARRADLQPILAEIRASGTTSLGQIAKALNERGIRTSRGSDWQAVQVKRALE